MDEAGTAIDLKFLRFEQVGWYQKLYDRTSTNMEKGLDVIDTGKGAEEVQVEKPHQVDCVCV